MQAADAANSAFEDHKPSEGSVISRNAAMIMLDCAMQDLNRHDNRKAEPLATADAVTRKLEEKLAKYGVTELVICDNNNNGYFDKNDEVLIGIKGSRWSAETKETVKYEPNSQHDHAKELNFNQNQKDAVQKFGDGSFGEWFKNKTGNMGSVEEQKKFVTDVAKAFADTGHKVKYDIREQLGIVDLTIDGKPYMTNIRY